MRRRREPSARQLEVLRKHAVKPGEVRNPHGHNGSAAQRYRRIFEEEATDEKLRELARDSLKKARLREMTLERLWPKTERVEVGGIGETEQHERDAAAARLQQLLDAKAKT